MEAHEWDSTKFVNWVNVQLRRRDWNASDLARRLDVSSGTVSRWLSGERRPSPHSCDLIADALGADVDLVLVLAGHRPAEEPATTPDRRQDLIALLRRVDLTPDRLAGLEGTLLAWLEFDRASRSCSAGAK